MAVDQNLLHVTKSLVEHYPSLMYLVTSEVEGRLASLPVEWALKKYKDDIAAYLISQMEHNR